MSFDLSLMPARSCRDLGWAGQGFCAFPATDFAPSTDGGRENAGKRAQEDFPSLSCGRSGVTPGKVSGGPREEGAVWSSWSDDLGPGASLRDLGLLSPSLPAELTAFH